LFKSVDLSQPNPTNGVTSGNPIDSNHQKVNEKSTGAIEYTDSKIQTGSTHKSNLGNPSSTNTLTKLNA